MASPNVLEGDVRITGNLSVIGTIPSVARTSLAQDVSQYYHLPIERWRVWDAHATSLPATSANDDLGVYTGTWGTSVPYIATSDLKAAGATTRYAATTFIMPPEYVAGGSVRICADAGMLTAVADTSCVLDFEAYESDNDTTTGGSDLVTTAATTINSLTFGEKTYTVTATSLAPGDLLHIRMTVTCTDGAGGSAVIAAIARVGLKLTIQG